MKKIICLFALSWLAASGVHSQTPTFKHPLPQVLSEFGATLTPVGDDVLIGAPGRGEVYLFDGATRTHIRTFSKSDPVSGDRFGHAIAVKGDTVIIGAPLDDLRATDAGVVYLFNLNTGARLDTLQKFTPATQDSFGYALAVINGVIAVGAPDDDLGAANAGAVYLFDGTSSTPFDTIPNPVTAATEYFGAALTVVGSSLAVSAYSNGSARADAGAVYLFDGTGSDIPTKTILGSDYDTFGLTVGFGYSLSASGGRLVTGTPFTAEAFLLETDGALVQRYPRPAVIGASNFGVAVAASSAQILIGAPGDRLSSTDDGYAFHFDASTSAPRDTLNNPSGLPSDDFGRAVALLGKRALVGAPFANSDSGLVYSFPLPLGQLPPVLAEIPDQIMREKATITVPLSATDPNGGKLILDVKNLPAFASFADSGNGKGSITFAPRRGDAGSYGLRVLAFDDGMPVLSDTTEFAMVVRPAAQNLVLNEILFDPNYEDLGQEHIELKNASRDSIRLIDWSLRVQRSNLTTAWRFPDTAVLAPDSLLVIHWLSTGQDDARNLFTGSPSADNFFGNNRSSAHDMKLGGSVDGVEHLPFAITLMQSPAFDLEINLDRIVDFVQFGNVVPAAHDPAVAAGLWLPREFLELHRTGFSFELRVNPTDSLRTGQADYVMQGSPSLGFRNKIAAPPELHLLISEVCVRPNASEFVEIYNPSDTTISLRHYYLTDIVNTGRAFDYAFITNGLPDSLVDRGDFLAKFPDTSKIAPKQYRTLAVSGRKFRDRFQVSPNYELASDDPTTADMVIVKAGDDRRDLVNLDDFNEALLIIKWDGANDLIEDVDYITWGPRDDNGNLNLAVNKTGVGIDGGDADTTRSYYDTDTDAKLQKPVQGSGHVLLRSWQRPPRAQPEEVGELRAGSNGISGHDETSEDLAASFEQAVPTPGSGSKELDLEFAFAFVVDTLENRGGVKGDDDGFLDPGERIKLFIKLRNLDVDSTGTLFSILRDTTGLIDFGSDSTAEYRSIAPDTAEFSTDSYELNVADALLPSVIKLQLIVVNKYGGSVHSDTLSISLLTNLDGSSIALAKRGNHVLAFFRLHNTAGSPTEKLKARMILNSVGSDSLQTIDDILAGGVSPKPQQISLPINNNMTLQQALDAGNLDVCIRINSTVQNSRVPFDLTHIVKPLTVFVEYYRSRTVVPGITASLVQNGVMLATAMTDTNGIAQFDVQLVNDVNYSVVLQRPESQQLDFLSYYQGIDLVNDLKSCDEALKPKKVGNTQTPADTLGDVGGVSGLTPADCEMIQIFARQVLTEIDLIGNAGQWKFGQFDQLSRFVELNQSTITVPACTAAPCSRQFLHVFAFRQGDVDYSWFPPDPEGTIPQVQIDTFDSMTRAEECNPPIIPPNQ